METFFISIFAFLILVGIIVTIHEFGHYITAVACRIKILEFSIGFGPKIFQKQLGKDKTLFTLRALPMGGYVKPLEQGAVTPEEWETLSETEKSRAFSQSPKWKKFLMVAGGPLSNFILAIIIFTGIFLYYGAEGVKPVISEVSSESMFYNHLKVGDEILAINDTPARFNHSAYGLLMDSLMQGKTIKVEYSNNTGVHLLELPVSKLNYDGLLLSQFDFHGINFEGLKGDVIFESVNPNGAAAKAGILPKDSLILVNGEKVNDITQVVKQFHKNPGKNFELTVERNNQQFKINVQPQKTLVEGREIGLIGVKTAIPYPTNIIRQDFSLSSAFHEAFFNTVRQIKTNAVVIGKMIVGQISTKTISGPLSIAEYSGTSFKMGTKYFFQMMAIISIAIGFFNILPIPMLDGGHLVQYTIEYIRRKDFSMAQLMFINKIGLGCLIGIFVLAISNDIIKYVEAYF
jgi:regulator of sigma E protease